MENFHVSLNSNFCVICDRLHNNMYITFPPSRRWDTNESSHNRHQMYWFGVSYLSKSFHSPAAKPYCSAADRMHSPSRHLACGWASSSVDGHIKDNRRCMVNC